MSDNNPEWLPDDYDRTDDLADRLPVMAGIDAGIELHATDKDGNRVVIGEPVELIVNSSNRTYQLRAGGDLHSWNYEVVVSEDSKATVRSVDLDQDIEDYEEDKKRVLNDGVDIRIWGVDVDRELVREDVGNF